MQLKYFFPVKFNTANAVSRVVRNGLHSNITYALHLCNTDLQKSGEAMIAVSYPGYRSGEFRCLGESALFFSESQTSLKTYKDRLQDIIADRCTMGTLEDVVFGSIQEIDPEKIKGYVRFKRYNYSHKNMAFWQKNQNLITDQKLQRAVEITLKYPFVRTRSVTEGTPIFLYVLRDELSQAEDFSIESEVEINTYGLIVNRKGYVPMF